MCIREARISHPQQVMFTLLMYAWLCGFVCGGASTACVVDHIIHQHLQGKFAGMCAKECTENFHQAGGLSSLQTTLVDWQACLPVHDVSILGLLQTSCTHSVMLQHVISARCGYCMELCRP